MNDESWLATIKANPRDWDLRAVYADWLEEHDYDEQAKAWREIAKNRWEPTDMTDYERRIPSSRGCNCNGWVWLLEKPTLSKDKDIPCSYALDKQTLNRPGNSYLPHQLFVRLFRKYSDDVAVRYDTYHAAEMDLLKALLLVQKAVPSQISETCWAGATE